MHTGLHSNSLFRGRRHKPLTVLDYLSSAPEQNPNRILINAPAPPPTVPFIFVSKSY